MELGEPKLRRLTPVDPLFSRHVVSEPDISEPRFIDWIIRTLEPHGIAPRKVLCGKTHIIETPSESVLTRSVLVASLNADASLRLQCLGLGARHGLGCGIFVAPQGD